MCHLVTEAKNMIPKYTLHSFNNILHSHGIAFFNFYHDQHDQKITVYFHNMFIIYLVTATALN